MMTMYTTTWCGRCVRLKHGLDRAGIRYAEIDIEQDAAAAVRVLHFNGGNQTVPMVVFPDGSALTNPTVEQVAAQLAA